MANAEKKLKGLFWRADYYGTYTEGGMPSMHYGLLNGFQKLGHKPFFVSSGRMSLPPDVDYYFIPYSNLFSNLPEVLTLPYNKRVVKKIMPIIEEEKPDFIYQHHAHFNYAGTLLKKKTGLPYFLQCEAVEYWAKANWGKLYFKKLLKWAEEIQWAAADAIVVISERVKEMMVELGVDADKIIVNPSAVNPDKFSPDVSDERIRKKLEIEKTFVCGFTGSFSQWHGVEVLAEAVKYIISEIPDAKILLVGDGLLRHNIEVIIKKDNVGDSTIITGIVPYGEIPEYLSACDILLSPCVSNEDGSEFFNSPIKLFEYLAMGKPIIATDVGQQSDVIQHNVNGLLCPERDPKALADGVIEIYKNKDLADRLSKEARKTAVEKYNWKFNAQRIVDAYHNIMAKR
ncbi:MAG: glycosyltransferase family 4 protein [Chlorobi bacterium]|nr:glycosyltransferase family 4 protein [Chlorobiota bacterium]